MLPVCAAGDERSRAHGVERGHTRPGQRERNRLPLAHAPLRPIRAAARDRQHADGAPARRGSVAAATRGSSRHARLTRRSSLGHPSVAAILAAVAHVLASIDNVLPAIANIFAPVADVFSSVPAIFDPVASSAIVPRVPNVLAPVAEILSAIAHVLTPVAHVLSSVADVLASIPHVLAPIA